VSNHPPKADGSREGVPLIARSRRGVVRLARSRAGREGRTPRREGVKAITGRGQRIGRRRTRAVGPGESESGARYLDPSFTVLAFAAGLVSFVGWGMWTGWIWGMETVRSSRPR
jgi:hypothetical protein